MPKRVIDFDAMWGSDKLASCAEWAQAEYAWLYGLADASGSFELSNLRVIWGRVAAIRRNLSIERLQEIFEEFQAKGLLLVWEHDGKRYAHWTGSDVPGRLPAPSWRARLEKLAPPVPKSALEEYVAGFSRGRATLTPGRCGFDYAATRGGESGSDAKGQEINGARQGESGAVNEAASNRADSCGGQLALRLEPECAGRVEAAQAQNWNLNLDLKFKKEGDFWKLTPGYADQSVRCGEAETKPPTKIPVYEKATANATAIANGSGIGQEPGITGENANYEQPPGNCVTNRQQQECAGPRATVGREWVAGNQRWAGTTQASWARAAAEKEARLRAEIYVGRGPEFDPNDLSPEVYERIRARAAARKA
jgi:hypothetical protein